MLIGAVATAGKARAVGWVAVIGAGVEKGFSLRCVVAALDAIEAVSEPRSAAIPSEGAGKFPSVASARLMGTGYGHETVSTPEEP